MDLNVLNEIVNSKIDAKYKGQFTLGNLIVALEDAPKDEYVLFDFGAFSPTNLDSYRGYYRFLALGYEEAGLEEGPTVGELLNDCRDAVGKTFTGYKGGDFVMDKSTFLWVANYSHTSNTMISSARMEDYNFIIHTKYVAD